MYKLTAPNVSSNDSYNAAVATIRLKAKRSIFQDAAAAVQEKCEIFDQLAATQQFNSARTTDFKVPEITDPHSMASLYDDQFMKGRRTEAIRDSIRNAASNSLCPYCGEGSVAQLDHYLPKSTFAGTAVHPANLVPSCIDCNYKKSSHAPDDKLLAVLHPYFDDALNIKWLNAALTKDALSSPVVDFFIMLEKNDAQLEKRLNAHMQVFSLAERFSIKAAQLLNDFEGMINSETMTLEMTREHLARMRGGYYANRVNSWQAAAYDAMLASDWYLTKYLNLK